MTSKKSCKYSDYGSFQHLLFFLWLYISVIFQSNIQWQSEEMNFLQWIKFFVNKVGSFVCFCFLWSKVYKGNHELWCKHKLFHKSTVIVLWHDMCTQSFAKIQVFTSLQQMHIAWNRVSYCKRKIKIDCHCSLSHFTSRLMYGEVHVSLNRWLINQLDKNEHGSLKPTFLISPSLTDHVCCNHEHRWPPPFCTLFSNIGLKGSRIRGSKIW